MGANESAAAPRRRRVRFWLWLLLTLAVLGGAGWMTLRYTVPGRVLVGRLASVPVLGPLIFRTGDGSGNASGAVPTEGAPSAPALPEGGAGDAGAGAAADEGAAAVLAGREALLRQREEDLAVQAAELTRRIAETQALQARLMSQAQGPRLADVVRAMSPSAAASALTNLTDAEFVGVLRSLDAQAAAEIMTKVEPSRAARLIQAWNAPLTAAGAPVALPAPAAGAPAAGNASGG